MATYSMPIVEASRPAFAQYTITASAASIASILGDNRTPAKLTIKNADGAANACYLGGAVVANTPTGAGVELGAGDSYTFEYQSPVEIFIVGTANAANIAFIVAEYSDRQT